MNLKNFIVKAIIKIERIHLQVILVLRDNTDTEGTFGTL